MAEAARKMENVHQGLKGKEGKYLTFTLGQEEYGIGIPEGPGNHRYPGDHLGSPNTGTYQGGNQSAR